MRHFPSFESDLKMMEALVSEESVFALPGQCFDYPNYMRLVLTLPKELTTEACDRIAHFCTKHFVECPNIDVSNVSIFGPPNNIVLNSKQVNSKEAGTENGSLIHSLKT